MNYLKHFLYLGLFAGLLASCGSDDDNDFMIQLRDPQEVYDEDLAELNAYLQTHFYNQDEFENTPAGDDFEIKFDTIAGENANRTPLSQQVTTRTLRRDNIDYQIFVLNVRQGSGPRQPTFADSTLLSYEGFLLDGRKFDGSQNSLWFNLPRAIDGFGAGVAGFNDATAVTPNDDGTITYSGGGIGAMFLPAGLSYFNSPPVGSIIPAYAPLIFTFQLRRVRITDHDGDGILSVFEDIDGDQNLASPNFGDNTDRDFDQNRQPLHNYLDADDDGDGIPTRLENADPNGDGNPDDALDSDGDGIPDYLDNRTEV